LRGLAHATRTINDPRETYAVLGVLKPLRQIIESIFDTLKGQLDLERHEAAASPASAPASANAFSP
jgi:hypothetical protein